MTKALVLYYSRTGNTEKMANAIFEAIKGSGKVEVDINYHVDPKELGSYDAIIVGAPTYNHDMPWTSRIFLLKLLVKALV